MESVPERENIQELMPGLSRVSDGARTQITYRWFSGVGSAFNKVVEILLFVCGIGVDIVTFNRVILIFSGKVNFSQAMVALFLFICGFFLAYRGLLMMINRSTFAVSEGRFSVRHGPLPGAANLNLSTYEITSVEWQKVGQSSRAAYTGNRLGSGYSAVFNVILTTQSDKKIILVSSIHAREYAFALSSEISNLLK